MAKTAKIKEEPAGISAMDQINRILKDNETDHYNFDPPIDYKVSSGSLIFDAALDGGLSPGAHRFIGVREGGKTSSALAFALNHQKTIENSFIVYFKAEGRLTENMKIKSGLDFSPDKVAVIDSNIFEFITDTMRTLIHENETKRRYVFIVDSVDALISQAEKEKTSEENVQPGTAGRMLSLMFKRISLGLSKRGHIGIFISQQRAIIEIDRYAPKQQHQGQSGGGNSLQHYVDFACEFLQPNKADYLLEDENDPNSKIIGKLCKVRFHKTTNEKTNTVIQYPIKWGRSNGNSIWREKEVADILLQFDHVKREGKGIKLNLESPFIKNVLTKYPDFKTEFPYLKTFYRFFDENSEIALDLWHQLKQTLAGNAS